MLDYTQRCKNCGCTRKEHGPRKPWRCKTRLKVSNWEPWTAGEYDAATRAAPIHAGGPESLE